ncbi:hypothetical protein EMPS_08690 [Entomortierella parvispora]|uniref:Uncharacterized protein n=1 Tax=Entomortierella parvispora TaxID=205924 RepID=A0A9P3LZC0_9FUNG|nr:hypothetical protein EMPS_08690 [Entomortierella parvispora]
MSAVSDSVPGSPAMDPSSTSFSSSTSSPSLFLSSGTHPSSASSSSRIRSHPSLLCLLLIICITLTSSISQTAASPPSTLISPIQSLGPTPHQAPAFISTKDKSTSLPPIDPLSVSLDSHLRKRQAEPVVTSTGAKPAAQTSTSTKSTKSKTVMSTSAAPAATTTSMITPIPDSKGDTALFGKPSVIGGYNLTSGILIYSAFLILFLVSVGAATWQRAKYRDQFRKQQNKMEGGKIVPSADGGKSRRGHGNTSEAELSDAALFKQASISKRALMKDVGPGGVLAANEAMRTKIAVANGAGRSFEDRQQQQSSVRFGDGNIASASGGRSGGMKKSSAPNIRGTGQDGYEMNSYGQVEDPLSYYQDNQDTTDYSRPPLTELHDPYYSSGSSHGGYLEQVEDYHSTPSGGSNPHMSKATSQGQPKFQPQVFVQRTNSSRMPQTDLHDGNNILRSNSGQRHVTGAPTRNGSGGASRANAPGAPVPSRITTQGLLDRSGSGGSSRTNSPIDGGMTRNLSNASSGRTRVSPSPTLMHPTPIARSNSTRLPPSMRGGVGTSSAQQGPSGLSQQTNNHDYM